MKKTFLITVSAMLLLFCACNNKSAKVEVVAESIENEDSVKYQRFDSISNALKSARKFENCNKVIANFYKYRNEDSLLVGIENFSFMDMEFLDTLLIFNFEKGTVKKVKRENDNNVNYSNYIKGFPTEKTVTGDFNGDGRKETLKVENYELLLNQYDSVELKKEINGSKFAYFRKGFDSFYFTSSDKKVPNLEVWGEMTFTIKNLRDLDGDGGDEIGFLYGKSTSNCHYFNVFTLKNNKWELLIENIPLTYDMRSTGVIPVEKDPKNKGVILIRYDSDMGSYYSSSYVIEESVKISELLKNIK